MRVRFTVDEDQFVHVDLVQRCTVDAVQQGAEIVVSLAGCESDPDDPEEEPVAHSITVEQSPSAILDLAVDEEDARPQFSRGSAARSLVSRTGGPTSPGHASTTHPAAGRARAWLLASALIAGCLWLYGLGAGGSFYFKAAQAPLRAAADAPYYRESLLHIGLAHALGLGGSIEAFRLFVLAAWWAALLYLAGVASRRLSPAHTALVLLVLASHPSAMIVHAWTCHPDAWTYLLTALLMFARRPAVVVALAAAGAWNHLAMWLVICAQTALLWLAFAEPGARRRAIAAAVGLVAGAASCKLVLALSGVHIGADRLALALREPAATLASYWTGPGWSVVYSLHFAHLLWLPLLLARLGRRAALAVLAAQLLALAATWFAQDTTRVFAVLAWASLCYGLVHALERREPEARWLPRLIGIAIAASLAGPHIYAWKGALHDTTRAREHLRGLVFGEVN